MSALLTRSWKVTVALPQTTSTFDLSANGGISNTSNDLVVDSLRVVFHITKTLEKEPNTMHLEIDNLSDASRSKMKSKGMLVTLEAGYENPNLGTDTRAIIFSGTSRICDHKHENTQWETKINCGDGEQAFATARIAKSFASGAGLADVIKYVAGQMKVNLGNLSQAIDQGGLPFQSFAHGTALNGNASDVFNTLMKTAGYQWSVQQGALLVVQAGKGASQEVVILNQSTGLIGSPEHTPPHKTKKPSYLVAKCLLNPKIRPGYLVRMDALNVKGDFVVQKVVHTGDSHGRGTTSWTTHFEALSSTQTTTDVS